MATVDGVKDWFLKQVLFPKIFVINTPGFVTGRYFELMGLGHFTRNVFMPETFLANLEKKTVEKLGDSGKNTLYEIGKSATWRFCKLMGFPSKSKQPLSRSGPVAFKFFETMYARSLTAEVDEPELTVTLHAKDMLICRKNGLGYFVSLGGLSGLWACMCEDKSISAVKPKCQGRGDDECLMIAGPVEKIKSNGQPIVLGEFGEYAEGANYSEYNKVVKLNGPSLESLMQKEFFSYKSGVLEIRGERFLPFEVGYLYIFEEEFNKLGADSLLYETSFDFYRNFAKEIKIENPKKFACDFFRAIGWGDFMLLESDKTTVECKCFPWTKLYSANSQFPIFAGSVSGFLSGILDKEIRLSVKKKTLVRSLSLTLEN